ncbi:MAG: phosphopantothenoylcysteine decarboxylase [Verrucomicrobia bacterium]|nr:phosphopantothenoylcysteine decarboxylase [Pseudomonadota bacterium]NBS06085.1 phosphopantothenoylcysteine decarboxylase [Verrucomicrobiota bacterium]NBS78694.1 phosphopantothenoylcysteine decarboxylase [bacterium]NBT23347.1 phosphopantothenoylcysteine decarboxylase [bacterium]NBV96114.1 phosphopantothenoylcysteine decarboxylase [Verrucomicrobiota bacterium]
MAERRPPCIVLGVTGSIAAFRAADLASGMVQKGWEVHAILTGDGARFITPLTLSALTHRPVHTSLWEEAEGGRMGHLDLARMADVVVVAPATADCLARAAHGMAGDVLGAVLLASRAPLVFAPAMNTQMWRHAATQANVRILTQRGARWVGPGEGRLACGEVGPGRMAPVAEILAEVGKALTKTKAKKVSP